jgi:predicted signal transduction protein with EAL and GGDEF domain
MMYATASFSVRRLTLRQLGRFVEGAGLELDVTEDILLLDEERGLDTFKRIQHLGVRIVFDDFRPGYASLSHLMKFPLDRAQDRQVICARTARRSSRRAFRSQKSPSGLCGSK